MQFLDCKITCASNFARVLSNTTSDSTKIIQFLSTTTFASQCPLQQPLGSISAVHVQELHTGIAAVFASCQSWNTPGWEVHVVPWCLIPVPASSPPCWHSSHAFPLTGRVWVSLVSFCCKTHTDTKKKKPSPVLSPGASLIYFLPLFQKTSNSQCRRFKGKTPPKCLADGYQGIAENPHDEGQNPTYLRISDFFYLNKAILLM